MKNSTEHLVIIGGNPAGMSAASKARRLESDIPITVFEKTGFVTYGSCGLPYYISDKIKDINELITYTPEYLKKEKNIDVKVFHEVTDIDLKEKKVIVKDLRKGIFFEQQFSNLIIATGASPVIPPLLRNELENVFSLRTVEDGIKIKNVLAENCFKTAAIIGAGYIGLEMAEALKELGINVMVFEMLPRILPQLDEEVVKYAEKELLDNGVEIYKNTKVSKLVGSDKNRVCQIITEDGKILSVDLVIVAVGVRPNSDLARKAGIKIGYKDAIVVDEFQRTNVPNVWACGDCVQTINLISKTPEYIPLGTTANKQGKIAGENVLGGKAKFPGVLGTQIIKIFSTYISTTGLSESKARTLGFNNIGTSTVITNDRASYYPGRRSGFIKVVFDTLSGKILGAQLAGSEAMAKRVNIFATAITAGMTVYDLSSLDFAYAPPVAPVYDPVIVAVSACVKRLAK